MGQSETLNIIEKNRGRTKKEILELLSNKNPVGERAVSEHLKKLIKNGEVFCRERLLKFEGVKTLEKRYFPTN